MSEEFFEMMEAVARTDIKMLKEKEKEYGHSWKKRGGVGAFMNLGRKFDRVENQSMANGYDIFKTIELDPRPTGPIDGIRDLRGYLFLIETHLLMGEVISLAGFQEELTKHMTNVVNKLNDIEEKEALLNSAKKKAVPIYINFEIQPPQWAEFMHSVDRGWEWTDRNVDADDLQHWPGYDKPLSCPLKEGETKLVDGINYMATDVSAPVIRENGIWEWEVLAIPLPLVDLSKEGPLG